MPRQEARVAGHLMRRLVADDLDVGVFALDLDQHLQRVGQADDIGRVARPASRIASFFWPAAWFDSSASAP